MFHRNKGQKISLKHFKLLSPIQLKVQGLRMLLLLIPLAHLLLWQQVALLPRDSQRSHAAWSFYHRIFCRVWVVLKAANTIRLQEAKYIRFLLL